MKTIDTEICILGGGPAGSVIARQLARLGHDVLMVDRGFQEGRLRAESLAPSIVPILDSLQLGAAVEAAVFARESRALLSWEGGSIQEKWFVKGPFILVERPRLDAIFRRAAAEAGACILHPALGRRPQQVFRGGWRIEIVTANGGINVATRFLVDARGKRRRGNWSTRELRFEPRHSPLCATSLGARNARLKPGPISGSGAARCRGTNHGDDISRSEACRRIEHKSARRYCSISDFAYKTSAHA